MRFLIILTVSLLAFAAPRGAVGQSATKVDTTGVEQALAAIAARKWDQLDDLMNGISDPVARALLEWQRLRRDNGNWSEYVEFLTEHPDWPGLKSLRAKGEVKIPTDAEPKVVISYFAAEQPQTGIGAVRLVKAYAKDGQPDKARAEAIRAWTTLSLTTTLETTLLAEYEDTLKPHHIARQDMLLWRGRISAARRMMPLVPEERQTLALARIALQETADGVDAAIERVPKALQLDGGLAYDRFMWRVKKNRWDDAEALLAEQSADVSNLGRAEEWGNRRRTYARRAMRAGDPDLAYWLASQHGLSEGSDYADLEWIAGYVALRKLAAPEQAAIHFENHYNAVRTPISLGRAGYWRGRAAEALKDFDKAAEYFRQGAEHQTSFYGQLAAEKIAAEPDIQLTGTGEVKDWADSPLAASSPVRAGLLLHAIDRQYLMRWFFSHVAETTSQEQTTHLADLALSLDRPYVALAVAKEAAKRGFILPRSYFPVTELAKHSGDVAPELALAIARRESELNPEAVSPAGARGLMQVMPGTAKEVAKDIGVEYSKTRLSEDWRYNAQLGTAYLASMLERYDGSYILAFAAYNAGPHRADRWIEEFGDPRAPQIDQIDWIEHIPYRETRNYVMRVSEALFVYRMRLSGTAKPLRLSKDLIGG
ncbi:lytic transglycosylase domain-containing protein [Neptunicoccus cionae]|nr:lytic transglycosylase domain-containing protein [Amylibacter cionae]